MAQVLELLQGKKTHLLILVAIVLYLFGIIDTPEGTSFSNLSSNDLMMVVLGGVASAFKAGFNRVEKNGG